MKKSICHFLAITLLFLVPNVSSAASADTITIHSQALQADSKVVVILPYSYAKNESNRYPVVYLLHGYSGDYSNWIKKVPEIQRYADQFQIMIVCPDAKNSWYIDSKTTPHSNYETYVGRELPRYIDSAYKSISTKNGRAICGLSMGGHGALFLAISHQETFGAAGSMSGALELMPQKYGIENIIGDTSAAAIQKYSVIDLPDMIKINIPLIIDCGISDPFIGINRRMHEKLIQDKIPHDYIERFGGHSWDYWANAVGYQLLFFHLHFEKARIHARANGI